MTQDHRPSPIRVGKRHFPVSMLSRAVRFVNHSASGAIDSSRPVRGDDVPVNPDLQRRAALAWLTLAGGMLDAATAGPLPEAGEDFGRIESLGALRAEGIAARTIDVWLPPGYERNRRYAVLYMHDGQMLFDPAGTWNRKAWRVDRAASRLLAAGRLRDFIVVAIPNDPQRRFAEFFPQAALTNLQPPALRDAFVREALGGRPAADDYLRFVVEVVKPRIDAAYPVFTDRDSTFIMGSSMGGLISLYALCEHPEIFGAAAVMSSHWIGTFERNTEFPAALLAWLRERLPAPGSCRLYMDRGTGTLDALYDVAQRQADELLLEKGYRPPRFLSKVFEGAGHDEDSWGARLGEPLGFLLGSLLPGGDTG